MRGRDGTIRLAQESAKKAGTYLMPPRYREIMDESERARLLIPKGALAIEAEVEDHQTSGDWWKHFTLMKDAGYPPEEIDRRLGAGPPKDQGLGIITIEETAQFDRQPGGNKMPHINRVRKRAYIEALKVRWAPRIDYETLSEGAPSDTDEYIIEGEWMEAEISEEVSPEKLEAKSKDAVDVLYGETDENPKPKPEIKRPYPPEIVRDRVFQFAVGFKGAQKTEKRGKDLTLPQFVAWQLNECFPGPNSDGKRISIVKYIFGEKVESLNDLTGAQLKAIEKWLDPKSEGPGAGLLPCKEAQMEAASIWATWMKSKGQMEANL
jgi:hypothetical protein